MSIVWLHAASGPRRDLGGKASALARLVRCGLPVPAGFVVPASAFSEHVARVRAQGSLSAAAVRATPPPPALVQAIRQAAGSLGPALAVRSSGLAEDGAQQSFAGQFDSVLGVTQSGVVAAVQQVWASALRDRVAAYRGSDELPALAVLVQTLVPATTAGVLFTVNPATGSWREMTVEAARGLGEAVVSGQVVPDFYRVRRPRRTPRAVQRVLARLRLEVLSVTPGAQDRQWQLGEAGVEEAPVPEPLRGVPCLDHATVRRLCRLGLRAEALLGGPQDVEWAIDSAGTLHVLQSRPVTTAHAIRRSGPVLWTRRFLGERWTEPATPLGWSEMKALLDWFIAYPRTSRRYLGGGEPTRLVRFSPYVNVTAFRHLAFKLPGSAPPAFLVELLPPSEEQAFLRRRAAPPDLAVYASILRETVRERRWERFRWNPLLNWKAWADFAPTLEAAVASMSPITSRDDALRRLVRCRGLAREYIKIHICSLLFANIWFEAATAALQAAGEGDAAPALLQPPSDSATARTNQALWRLGRGTLSLDRFLAEYGHRAANSWELFSPRWREAPQLALSLAKASARAPDPSLRAAERARDEARRLAALPLGLRAVVRLAQRYLLLREEQRFAFDRLLWRWKEPLLWLEDDLQLSLRFLDRAELDGLLQGKLPTEVARRLVSERSAAWAAEVERRRAGDLPPEFLTDDEALVAATDGQRLVGQGISAGVATGPARVLRSLDDATRLQPGDVLVTSATDPSWTPLFHVASAVVLELGGMLSHGAVVAREYGVPAVARAAGATQRIPDGAVVTVDGGRGVVWLQ